MVGRNKTGNSAKQIQSWFEKPKALEGAEMKIKDVIEEYEDGNGQIFVDQNSGVVRGWTANSFEDGRTFAALQTFFPAAERRGSIVRLGGWWSLSAMFSTLAEAKSRSKSSRVNSLHVCNVDKTVTRI